jgi:hypothetical protein
MTLNNPITEPQIPAPIARDLEVDIKVNGHRDAAHPHSQYWLKNEADARYRQTGVNQIFNPTVKNIGLSNGIIGTVSSASNQCGIEVQSSNSSSGAFLSFHRPGIYGLHLGLDINNQLSLGGWSMGPVSYKLLHEGIPISVKGGLAPNAAAAGNSVVLTWNSIQNGLGTVEIINYSGLGGGDTLSVYRKPGADENPPTISNRVARIDIGGAYIQTSDSRVKTDFFPAPGLETLLLLNPVKYNHWVCTGFDKDKKRIKLGKNFTKKIGFVAQDVQKILNEAVSIPSEEEELWGIDYNCILACCVKAIKDLNDLLQQQQQEISNLRLLINQNSGSTKS